MVNMMQAMFQRRQGFCHLITKHSGSCFLSLNLPSKNLSPFREESVLRQIPRSVHFNFPSFKKKKKDFQFKLMINMPKVSLHLKRFTQ